MKYDVIVIGFGAMGSAACFQLAKRKSKVLGIDRFSPPHSIGSSHGETRITRKAIGEGSHYVPLALRSYEIWREIEAETGADLLTVTGGLIMASRGGKGGLHGSESFIGETIAAAEKFGIKHRRLSAGDISREFPQFRLIGDEEGYFEDDAGFLRPENCISAQLALAEKYGAEIRRDEKVLEIRPGKAGIEVTTGQCTYLAEQAIISAGPWVKEFLPPSCRELFKVYRQVLYWFETGENYTQFKVGNCPIFIWEFGRWQNDFIYGFPAIDGPGGGFKAASEEFLEAIEPDMADRQIGDGEKAAIYRNYLAERIPGALPGCLKAATCLYTSTPDSGFIVDKLPEDERIILASPCSGHGFKHSAAIGEILAELATEGESHFDISRFSLKRFL